MPKGQLSTSAHRPPWGLYGWPSTIKCHGHLLGVQSDQFRWSRLGEDLICHKLRTFLLQSYAVWVEECRGNIPEACKQDVCLAQNMEVYIDDMLVKSAREVSYLDDLRETFDTLRLYDMKLNPSNCVFGVASRKFLGFMVSQCGIEANLNKVWAIMEMAPLKKSRRCKT